MAKAATARPGTPRYLLEAVLTGTAPTEPNGCILWPFSTTNGYAEVRIDWKKRYVGRVVLEHFEGPRPSSLHGMGHAPHDVCGNRNCVAPAHLTWQTRVEQVANQRIDGTFAPLRGQVRGETHPCATFSDEEVARAIRQVRAGESAASVAREYGVSHSAVKHWVRGRTRKAAYALADRTAP